jgi:hypothetical protein
MLSRPERASIAAHVKRCVHCQSEIEELQRFMGAPPRPQESPAPSAGAWIRAVTAQLVSPGAAQALRGAARGPRSESFTPPDSDAVITLQWEPARAAPTALSGQIADLSEERWVGALVEIRQAGALVASTTVDDLGSFYLDKLPPGAVQLRLLPRGGQIVLLPEIDLA